MSLLDDESILLDPERDKLIIGNWIARNYEILGKYVIHDEDTVNRVVDINGFLTIRDKDIRSITEGLFTIGKVTHNVNIVNCPNLENLEGAPEWVDGSFSCSECLGLKDLTGAPKCVKDNFYCYSCTNLRSFKGIENTFINDMFDFSWCSHIEDTRYLPGSAQLVCFEHCDIDSNVKLKIIEACQQRSIKIRF